MNFPEHSTLHLSTTPWSYYPDIASPQRRFGLLPGRSPLLGESLLFSSPGGTKMFQFPPFASLHCVGIIALQAIGLSHSEISGSKVICTYPKLIAAYHVLHRLREPRHPPCALFYFRQWVRYKRTSLILSAVDSSNLQSCLCQYVKDLMGNARKLSG